MGKKIVASRDIQAGALIIEADLAYKSPGDGLSPALSQSILGKKATRKISSGESLKIEDAS